MAHAPGAVEYDETTPMVAGKFSAEGREKDRAEHAKGPHYWVQFAVDIVDKVYSLILFIGAIYQMTGLTNTLFPYETWEIAIVVRVGTTCLLSLWWTVCEIFNTRARDRGDSALPCPERISSLWYYWYIFAVWVVTTGFYAKFYADHTVNTTATQDSSFNIKMMLVWFSAYVDMQDYARWLLRIPIDRILMRCGSKCYGC